MSENRWLATGNFFTSYKAEQRIFVTNVDRLLFVGLLLLLFVWPLIFEVGNKYLLVIDSILIAIVAVYGLNLLTGFTGLISIGHAAFVGIGAYTAALFAAASEIGGVIAGRDAAEQAALRVYGTNIGLAFQLIDDALDYSGEAAKLGKRVGDDFREGKITLPVVLSYRRGGAEERAFWQRTLQAGDIKDGDLDEAITLMVRHNAIEETIERARHYGCEAQKALGIFPMSEAKSAMLDAVDFSVNRAH